MTNQEAIGLLKIERVRITPTVFTEIVEAIDMAIKALEAQEAKTQLSAEGTTFDLISRQAAIEAVEHITSSMSVCVNTEECHGMKRMQRQAVIELANLPSAQPEPCNLPQLGATYEDGDELDEAIRHCDEIVQDITWFCNSPSKYIEQRRHESAVKLRQLASWLRELKRLKSEKEKMIDALSEKMCYMNTCPNERDAILRIVGGTTNCENHCNADCNNTNCESYRYGGRDERTD